MADLVVLVSHDVPSLLSPVVPDALNFTTQKGRHAALVGDYAEGLGFLPPRSQKRDPCTFGKSLICKDGHNLCSSSPGVQPEKREGPNETSKPTLGQSRSRAY